MSTTPMCPQAVTFDLDGTLYDARRFLYAFAFANLFRWRPVRAVTRVRAELRSVVFDDGAGFFQEEARRTAVRLAMTPEETRALLDDLFGPRLCASLARVGPRPDVVTSVRRLVEAGVRVGVVSDYRVEDKLSALGLMDLPWSALVAADALGALKPHRRAYDRAAEALGVAPEGIVHIGDRLDTDVRGAQAAGYGGAVLIGKPAPGVTSAATLSEASRILLAG